MTLLSDMNLSRKIHGHADDLFWPLIYLEWLTWHTYTFNYCLGPVYTTPVTSERSDFILD